jgi:hypothetical protein
MTGMSRAFLLSLACFGCVVADPDLETTEQPVIYADGCPPKECGSNSSVINGVYFYELPTSIGVANTEGVKLLGYLGLPPGTTRLDVYGNELVARNAAATIVVKGPKLIGSTFVLEVDGKVVHLQVTDFHRTLRYWAADDPTELLSSYTFKYITLGVSSIPTPLCTVVDLADGAAALDAFVFEGDRYDPKTKLVSTGVATRGWFNIACMGGAPAKMFRMRATTASSNPAKGIATGLAQRQSLFNLWIANYCGDGTPFTVPGEPLRVRDAAKWIPQSSAWSWQEPADLGSYGAVGGPGGAVCLDTPRRDDDAPGYRTVIEDHCKSVGHELPRCDELDVFPEGWQLLGRYASANPADEQ